MRRLRFNKPHPMNCPHCGKPIPRKLAAAVMGAKGGKTKGQSKARRSEQATAAVMARWAKWRAEKAKAKR
jgi:hypothetical protein